MLTTPPVPMKLRVVSMASRSLALSLLSARAQGVEQDHQAVIGVTAEARHRLSGVLLVQGLVVDQHFLLRIAVRQFVGDQQRGGGQAHAFGGGAGEFDILLGADAMALIERQRDAELPVVARDRRRSLAEAGIDHGLNAGRGLDGASCAVTSGSPGL